MVVTWDSTQNLSLKHMILHFGSDLRDRTYFSWRIISPSILSYVMEQDKDICWAVAIIRQLEALFRMSGLSVELSIQEFVNLVPAHLKEKDMKGAITDIEKALEYLKSDGTVEAAVRPITGTINQKISFSEDGQMEFKRFKIADFKVVYLSPEDEEENEYDEKIYENFEHKLESALKDGPVTARVIMCNSNSGVEGKSVYDPSGNELLSPTWGHFMLLVGMGIDENGVPFWESQNSGGKELGDNGYTRVARHRGLVTTFILLQ